MGTLAQSSPTMQGLLVLASLTVISAQIIPYGGLGYPYGYSGLGLGYGGLGLPYTYGANIVKPVKENQGIYHHSQRVHLPDTVDLVDRSASPSSTGSMDLNDFLIKGYAKQIKERNSTTANVHYHSLHGSK